MQKNFKSALEFAGTLAAILCVVDCVVIPIAVALSPLLGIHEIVHGINDQMATLVVVVLCSAAFFPGYLKHRNNKVLALVASGILLVFFGNMLGESMDKILHASLCLAGSACIIRANFLSKKLASKACHCDMH
jgi:hypothetical protein